MGRIQLTQRNVVLAILALLTLASWITVVSLVASVGGERAFLSGAALSTMATTVLAAVYWHYNWQPARHLLLVFLTAMVALTTNTNEPPSFVIAIPPAVGLLVAAPSWVIGSAVSLYAVLLVRSLMADDRVHYLNPVVVVMYLLLVGTLILVRLVTEAMGRTAADRAQEVEAQRALLEQQASALAEANRAQEEQLQQQRTLLDLVGTLETPAVRLADGVLFAPIVGHLDGRRAKALTARLLEAARVQRADTVVLDVAGVAALDSATALALLETVRALRLLGCEVAISGITAAVALTLSQQSVRFEDVTIARNPQDVLSRRVTKAAVRAIASPH
ncbi:MAG TPA: STAS domain-containing protein [Roseiflexaceae bacterium]|nr:STAS domain-containing protein [Roseiflexaceae bacterium]